MSYIDFALYFFFVSMYIVDNIPKYRERVLNRSDLDFASVADKYLDLYIN